jgi:ATP/maltotriose-dependent transcriptional regulator MalT
LASAYHKAGRLPEAFAEVNKLQHRVVRQGQHARDSELLRLKGLLLSIKGDSVAAEQCLQSAIRIARRQSAKILELTATTELARLLAQQGHRDQAYMMLSKIYNWFTEGFETRALKRAKAVLEELRN